MRSSESLPRKAVVLFVLLAWTLLFLHACQDATDPHSPQFVVTGEKQLVISGLGTGSGTVTAPVTAGRKAINCVITAGQAGATDCSRYYPKNTVVTLTAVPTAGSTFTGWSGACTGS